jgi:hypothetical protein
MSNPRQFRINLGKAFENETKERILTATKKVAFEVLKRVVEKTPVDTGRARGNWIVSVGAPDHSADGAEDKSSGGLATVSREATKIKAISEPATIFVQNNLPYIEKLENGSSVQAPAGMVAVTIAEIQAGFVK